MMIAVNCLAALSGAASWSLALGGDVMLNGVPPELEPLARVAPIFSAADLAIVNLEIPLTNAATPTTRKTRQELARKAQFILKASPAHAPAITAAGIDLVTLGNNHAMDYGPKGLAEMAALLQRHDVRFAGAGSTAAEASRPALLRTPTGARVAVVSYLAFRTSKGLNTCWPATARTAGIAALDLGGVMDESARERLAAIVARCRKAADFVLVALHWGVERETVPNAYQVALGRAFIGAGADLVVGHHPHVLQGSEVHRGKLIVYSLGNLVSPLPGTTALFVLRFEGSELRDIELHPCRIAGGRVAPLAGGSAVAALAAYKALCSKLRARHPSTDSAPPNLSLGQIAASQSRR